MIAFQTQRGGNFEIYVMNLDGSELRPLATASSDELWPSWGPSAPPSVINLLERSSQEFGMRETFQAALGDLDGDGDLDVVIGRFKGRAEIWFNLNGQEEKEQQ